MDQCDACMAAGGIEGGCDSCAAGRRRRKAHVRNQRENAGGEIDERD